MATQLDLRHTPGAGITESQVFTKAADGVVSVIYEADKCISAWIEYTQDPAVPGSIAQAVIAPSDSSSIYAPYMLTGATYVVKASVGINGFFRATILE